ncbi:MAG: FecR family protein [Bacteroidales bacterium]|jgi:ferric-dicitrate binding protein FerR (iron transport regulator)|nr:FecR family protein [Bacteroidales bacterium]
MITKDNKKTVDRAWNRLHSRLEQDGLLNEKQRNSNNRLLRSIAWQTGIAAILVLALFIFRGFFMTTHNDEIIAVHTFSDDIKDTYFAMMLNDGSVVYVADSSTFSYSLHFNESKRKVILNGEAFFDVKKNTAHPFYVETDFAYIEVIGTTFGVQSFKSGEFKVSVSSGEVNVKLKNTDQNIHVKAGECITLEHGKLHIRHDERALQFDPYHGKIYFKEMALTDILEIVNKRNSGKTSIVAQELDDYVLTATFANDDPATIANLICKTLNLVFSYQENVILIHEVQQKK